MKLFILVLSLYSFLFANSDATTCTKCHPIISKEFEASMHKKSSIYDDKIHKAVWDLHPSKAKDDYKCAKCHTPNITKKEEQHKGITCISCHTIKNVEKHSASNKNIYSKKEKTFYSAQKGRENEKVIYKKVDSWFGMNRTTVGSPYHDIDYTNDIYYTGEVCMGCHSHKKNSHQFDVCTTEEEGAKNKDSNCITCHMPKVDGSATTVRLSKQHSFHGFAGAIVQPKLLEQYVTIDFKKSNDYFEILIKNEAPHNLMTHPLRVVQLRSTILRGTKQIPLKTETFVKVIGKDKKPSMPWLANEIVKDTMIKANETRNVKFDEILKAGDRLEVKLGYYLVNPKAVKKLNLEKEKELTKFTVLKSKYFDIK